MKKITVDDFSDEYKKMINDYVSPLDIKLYGKKYDYSNYLDFFKGIEFDNYLSVGEVNDLFDDIIKAPNDKNKSNAGFGYRTRYFDEFNKIYYMDSPRIVLAMNDNGKYAQVACEPFNNSDDYPLIANFKMSQFTDDGLYVINLYPSAGDTTKFAFLRFVDNDSIKEYAEKFHMSFDEAKYILSKIDDVMFALSKNLDDLHPSFEQLTFKYDVKGADFLKLYNKIFREGVLYAVDIVRSGGVFELTDEDKKFYEEKEINESIQESSLNDSNVETYGISAANSIPSVEKRNDVAERLQALKDAGIKLSSEQESLISINNKINSQEFKDYKANSEARKKSQEEETTKRVEISKKREEWQNSPEHPVNKRIEELEKIKKQVKALEQFRNIDESLLTPEQKEMLDKGSIFLEMYGKAESEEHYVDTGMSQEIRDWYKDVYSEQETSHKSR